MSDYIDRQAAIDAINKAFERVFAWDGTGPLGDKVLENVPSVQPTLYGYKIEHLAYIARVMEKEGITAEQATESFDDICTAIRLLIEETTQKVNEFVREMRMEE